MSMFIIQIHNIMTDFLFNEFIINKFVVTVNAALILQMIATLRELHHLLLWLLMVVFLSRQKITSGS